MLSFKRDPYLAVFYIVCALLSAWLIWAGKITLRELGAFGFGSALVPALVERRQRPEANADEKDPPP